jgi:hypothetical protein
MLALICAAASSADMPSFAATFAQDMIHEWTPLPDDGQAETTSVNVIFIKTVPY